MRKSSSRKKNDYSMNIDSLVKNIQKMIFVPRKKSASPGSKERCKSLCPSITVRDTQRAREIMLALVFCARFRDG